VDIDRATGETLDQTGVSIDDAKAGVVTHEPKFAQANAPGAE
jgi:hypothetical protein